MSGYRLPQGGALITRDMPVGFTFDGRPHTGFAGDTLASALLATGRRLFARSFKYHRPRGVVSAGPEEPCALVTLRDGARREPNMPATMAELYEGLSAHSQNRWPSLALDVNAINGLFAPLFVAGFYYKTFMGPTRKAWHLYEHVIRRAAGMGAATLEADPDRYERATAHCDVLVVGAGAAGLSAALAAARGGARVILCDEHPAPAQRLSGVTGTVNGQPLLAWTRATMTALRALPNVRVLTRTTAYGLYDGPTVGAVERVADHKAEPVAGEPRQRHWTLVPRHIILATGAIERPLVFAGNDLPGVMLADAARSYAENYGVAPGRQVVVFTNNDSGHRAALALAACGVTVAAVIDPRPDGGVAHAEALAAQDIRRLPGAVVARATGGKGVKRAEVHAYDAATGTLGRRLAVLDTDCLAVSGGWTPTIHLASQTGGKPVFDETLHAFVPGPTPPWLTCVGAAAGDLSLDSAIATATRAGSESAPVPTVTEEPDGQTLLPLWEVPAPRGGGKKFVDLQHDVTADDLRLAHREGYRSVEHMKRYTTLGMAGDQGKTSNVNAMAVMAEARAATVAEVGTTRFRPPYTPVSLGALAGRAVGAHFRPERRTPMHDWHLAHGAEMIQAGPWLRPRVYRRGGESLDQAIAREARAVREAVGMVDVTTLGKIDVQGPDAPEFLNRVYVNGFGKLPVGKARYGVMLRDDGIVYDDGTTWRLSETRYLMTTTTARAAGVLSHLENLLAVRWPDLRVQVTSVSDQWASVAVAGPRSRETLRRVIPDIDFGDDALPLMGVREGSLNSLPVLVARLSFSGERAYEVYCPFRHGDAMWRAIMAAGEPFGITPYGTEALGVLRIEKGHVSGPELDGRTTLDDLGLGRMASSKKAFIGKVLRHRPALMAADRKVLVGLISETGEPLTGGAHLVTSADPAAPGRSEGHVTSPAVSPALGRPIALGLLERGRDRHGDVLYATDPLRQRHVKVRITAPCLFDPEGDRLHA